jgi:hypothetical protein
MKKETEDRLTRRKFLKTSVGAAAMIGCFTKAELREALAEANAAGKPLLNGANINLHINHSMPTLQSHVADFKHDPLGYLEKYFYIRPSQRAFLAELFDSETLASLKAFLDKRAQDKKTFKVTLTHKEPNLSSTMDPSPLRSRIAYASLSLEKRADVKYNYNQKTGHEIQVSAGMSC